MKKALLAALIGVLGLAAATVVTSILRPDLAYQGVMGVERAIAGLSPASIEAGGLNWAYHEGGQGPTLVLIHGFSADKDNWVRIGRQLTHRFHVVAPDLIGFGDSDRPDDLSYAIDAQAERLLGFLDAKGIDQAHFGGSSMGGYLASVIANQEPERVLSLWLLAPGGVYGGEPSEMIQRVFGGGSNPLIPATEADFAETLSFVFSDPPFISPSVRDYLARRQIQRRDLLEQIFSDLRYRSRPLEEYLAGFQGPVLITWGEEDRVLHHSGAGVLRELLPQAEVQLMPGTGHLPMIERPGPTAERYLSFQESL